MATMATQDATESMGASSIGTGGSSQSSGERNPTVKSIEDVFNIYADDEDDSAAATNGVKLKEDKSQIPDELNNTTPKEVKKEEKVEEDKVEDVKQEAKPEAPISPDMHKVKVNGVEKEVPLQDLINSYSGNQEVQRRFTEFDKSKKAFESEKTNLTQFNDYVKQEIGDLKQSFEGLVNQYQKNGYLDKDPLGAVDNILDKMGINSNTFRRAMFEHQLPEFAKFFNMTDIERESHYAKQENEYLRKKEQGFNDRDQQVKLSQEKQRQDYDLIKNAGLDSVKYEELQNELLEAGHKDLNAEKVVEYAKQKPTLDKVVQVFNTIKVDPTQDPRARTVFKILTDFPDTTVDEILDHLDPQRAVLKSAKVLNDKAPKVSKVPPRKGDDVDFDEMMNFFKN
jgi:hypothetical protein